MRPKKEEIANIFIGHRAQPTSAGRLINCRLSNLAGVIIASFFKRLSVNDGEIKHSCSSLILIHESLDTWRVWNETNQDVMLDNMCSELHLSLIFFFSFD